MRRRELRLLRGAGETPLVLVHLYAELVRPFRPDPLLRNPLKKPAHLLELLGLSSGPRGMNRSPPLAVLLAALAAEVALGNSDALVADVALGNSEALVAEFALGNSEALVADVALGNSEALVADVVAAEADAFRPLRSLADTL